MMTSDPARNAPAEQQAALTDVLVQATFMTMAVLSGVAADNDLSLTQLRVLAILRDRRVRMSALAAYLGLDRSTMSGLVERAEKRGLLARAPDPSDGRAVDVLLTPGGAELADALYTRIEQELAPATGRLAAAERRRLQTLLRQLVGPEQ
jgi:MarR family transcriptional regulator, lower aerobic nicotinate degradation pathway regulator